MIEIGPVALLLAVLVAAAYYIHYVSAPQPKRALPLSRYLLVGTGAALLAYVPGAIVGIATACFPASAANLCGLVGVFGFGPVFAAVAIVAFARFKVQDARRRPTMRQPDRS